MEYRKEIIGDFMAIGNGKNEKWENMAANILDLQQKAFKTKSIEDIKAYAEADLDLHKRIIAKSETEIVKSEYLIKICDLAVSRGFKYWSENE